MTPSDNQHQRHEFPAKNAQPSHTIYQIGKVEFALRSQNRELKSGPGKRRPLWMLSCSDTRKTSHAANAKTKVARKATMQLHAEEVE
jgi:hypothetical protein